MSNQEYIAKGESVLGRLERLAENHKENDVFQNLLNDARDMYRFGQTSYDRGYKNGMRYKKENATLS